MKLSFHPPARRAVLVALSIAVTSLCASAQQHVARSGRFVLRASTVAANELPQAVRERHHIGDGQAVLNVSLQRRDDRGALANARADVKVQAHGLLGAPTEIDMREVTENGYVSYLGVYNFLPRQVLDFRIVARPQGATQPMELEFRDRLGRRK